MRGILGKCSLAGGLSPSILALIVSTQAAEKINFASNWVPGPRRAEFVAARYSGYFEKNGLDVDIRARAASTFAKPTFPAAPPFNMSGAKITVMLSVIGEWIGSEEGLGYLIIQSSAQIMTIREFAAAALFAWMGIALFIVASLGERPVTPWKRDG